MHVMLKRGFEKNHHLLLFFRNIKILNWINSKIISESIKPVQLKLQSIQLNFLLQKNFIYSLHKTISKIKLSKWRGIN